MPLNSSHARKQVQKFEWTMKRFEQFGRRIKTIINKVVTEIHLNNW